MTTPLSVKQILGGQAPADTPVTVKGWVRTRRDAKDFSFLEVNDGSCLANLQVIADQDTRNVSQIKDIGVGAAVAVSGSLIASPGKGQKCEVKATSVDLIGPCDQETYPLQKKRHSDEFLRTIAHLRPRTNTFYAVFRIRSLAAQYIHAFFEERGFV